MHKHYPLHPATAPAMPAMLAIKNGTKLVPQAALYRVAGPATLALASTPNAGKVWPAH